MLNYKVHIDKDSSFNTPPVFSIYACLLNLKQIKINGIKNIESENKLKQILYDEIDVIHVLMDLQKMKIEVK